MTPPFTDAKMPEVVARVAYAWLRFNYRHRITEKETPAGHLQAALDDLPLGVGSPVYSALLALEFHVIRGGDTRTWLSRAITLSRTGHGFRRCWYDDYKANRRDPRVTNRGVKRTRSLSQS